MTIQQYPRSPKSLLGGIAHLGRFIDKIRLRHAGKIQDYNYITVGFDKHLVDFLQIDPKSFSGSCDCTAMCYPEKRCSTSAAAQERF